MTQNGFEQLPPWFAVSPFRSKHDAPFPSAVVRVEFGARGRRSPRQSVNDDHYLVVRLSRHLETALTSLPDGELPARFDEYGYGMVVADGMASMGEAASRLAISTLMHLAICFGKGHVRVNEAIAEEMMNRAERFYRSIDATLVQAAQGDSRRLVTTLTTIYTAGAEAFLAHVGHSRAYLFRDNQLMQLTRDHTVGDDDTVSEKVVLDVGGGPPELYQMVTGMLGGPGRRIDIERFGLLDHDVLLACTNGLTDVVSDALITEVLRSEGTPDDHCRALLERATCAGGNDDATVVIGRYSIDG